MLLSNQERTDRILNTSHVILIDSSTVYRVDGLHWVGPVLFVNFEGIFYQDTELMTLEEASECEMTLYQAQKILNI